MKKYIIKNKKYILKIMIVIILIPCTAFYISQKYFQVMLIQGNSMIPTYHNMEFVILDKHTKEYTYGDIIAFDCDKLKAVLVKRIVACPNDQVEIRDKKLFINGQISSIYGNNELFEYSGIADSTIYLTKNQYFVIGDNINESKDSRYEEVGCVEEGCIIGKIIRAND